MEHRVRVNWLGATVVLALGVAVSLVTSTVVASRAINSRTKAVAKASQEITVKGSARRRVRSDLGVWSIQIRGEAPTIAAAYEQIEASERRVAQFLEAKGFPAAQRTLSAIESSTFYGRDEKGNTTREVTGYSLERTFTISSPDVERVYAAASEVTQLLKENIPVASRRPEFYYSKVADLKVQILGEATKDARTRAGEIATNSGCSIGEVRQAQMGVIQITQPDSTEVASYGRYDTSTIEKDVSVVVTLTLGIE